MLKKKEVLKIHEMSLDRKVVAQNALITTAKTNCQSCTFHLFFWWLRRSSNLFIHVPVLFCHSPYCIRTTGTPQQPIAWAYCCVCLSTTERSCCQNTLICAQTWGGPILPVSDVQGPRAGGSAPHTTTFSTVPLLLLMSDACTRAWGGTSPSPLRGSHQKTSKVRLY